MKERKKNINDGDSNRIKPSEAGNEIETSAPHSDPLLDHTVFQSVQMDLNQEPHTLLL